jgi:hypothetical protein
MDIADLWAMIVIALSFVLLVFIMGDCNDR